MGPTSWPIFPFEQLHNLCPEMFDSEPQVSIKRLGVGEVPLIALKFEIAHHNAELWTYSYL